MHHTFEQWHGYMPGSRRSNWPCSRRPPTSCLHRMMAQETLFRMINHSMIAEGYSLHGSVKRGGRPWRVMCQMFDFLFVVCVCRPWERERQTQKRPIFSPKSSHSHRGISTCEVSNTLQVSLSFYCHFSTTCVLIDSPSTNLSRNAWFLLLLVYVFTYIVASFVSFWNQRANPRQTLHIIMA